MNRNNRPFKQHDVPPGPPPSLRRVSRVSASPRVPVEPHRSPHGHQFAPHGPDLLRARLRKRQVVAPDQLKFDKLEGVRVFFFLVPLQGDLHGVVVLGAQLIVGTFRLGRRGKGRQESVAGWEVPNSQCRQHSSSRQRQPIRRMSGLELLPCRGKRDLVDVSVNPIAVLKIVLEERVDDVERGKDSDQIVIVVPGRVQSLVTGCFFGRGSRSRTFLWGYV